MALRISGPGVTLPRASSLFPRRLWTAPYTPNTARFLLSPGASAMIPAGTFLVAGMPPAQVQYLDPCTIEWTDFGPISPTQPEWGWSVFSDGFNLRVTNLSGVPNTATVTNPGSGYVQASTTVTPSDGNSEWQAIVGGTVTALPLASGGSGYTIAPTVFIHEPHFGFRATGTATITNGEVTALTLVGGGAGYTTPPGVGIGACPDDPNIEEIINAAAELPPIGGAGQITGIVQLKGGMPLAAAPTLTISGSGSGATAVVNPSPWIAPVVVSIRMQPIAG